MLKLEVHHSRARGGATGRTSTTHPRRCLPRHWRMAGRRHGRVSRSHHLGLKAPAETGALASAGQVQSARLVLRIETKRTCLADSSQAIDIVCRRRRLRFPPRPFFQRRPGYLPSEGPLLGVCFLMTSIRVQTFLSQLIEVLSAPRRRVAGSPHGDQGRLVRPLIFPTPTLFDPQKDIIDRIVTCRYSPSMAPHLPRAWDAVTHRWDIESMFSSPSVVWDCLTGPRVEMTCDLLHPLRRGGRS